MDLILKEDVKHLGFKDDIVSVKPGYGRNFLMPTKKATLATESARKVLAEDLKQKGLNGYQLIKKYEWKYQAKKMEEVYKYLLNKGSKPKFIYENSDKI